MLCCRAQGGKYIIILKIGQISPAVIEFCDENKKLQKIAVISSYLLCAVVLQYCIANFTLQFYSNHALAWVWTNHPTSLCILFWYQFLYTKLHGKV